MSHSDRWVAGPGLPPGLSADSVAGLISGTPTTAGTYTVALTAANISGSATATLTIVINPAITLTSPATASGQVGQSFTYQVTTASTVTNFSASGLPPGLTIDPNAGAISGAPTTAGVYAATLNLTTAEGTSVATLTITVAPNFPVVNGMLMWFRADAGVVADSNGNVSQWTDQSGLGNNAVLASGATSPLLVLSQANGPPVVRFNGPNALSLPVNVMQNAQEGEIIAIVKIASDPNDLNTLWNFGSGNGSAYFNTNHFDDFGNSDQGFAEVETQAQISQYYVYDTSIDVNGSAIYRYNGTPLWTRTSLGTGFNSSPAIGGAGAGNFYGDIAEIFVYSRALSSQEQSQIYSYLASKYSMPGIVGIVASPAITSGYFVTGTDSQPFSFQVTANGNPTSFSASGLPTGLSMNSVGLITGTPTSDGPFTVTVSATNAAGSGSSPLYITINAVAPVVTSASSATALAGQSFSYQITASFNPTSYSASGLPLGLSIDSNGFISGTPAASGVSTVILTAANSAGSETFDLTISVTAAQGSSQSLPYTTGFEVTDGFTVGALGGQNGWTVSAGSAAVTTLLSHTGTQSVQLAAGTPVTNAELILNSTPGETIEFCDFYAQPVAEASISNSTIFTVEGARFGFQQANGVGVLQIYRGNGTGGGDWEPTSFTVALGAGNQVSTWIRLTARLDFSGQSWGLYANGVLVATGIQLINSSSTYLSTFEIQGNASTATNIDDLYVGPNEPLFTDVNNDGIPDAWETANGLSLSANNANSHDFSSTLTDLEVYELGLNPAKGSIIDDSAVQLNVYAPHP